MAEEIKNQPQIPKDQEIWFHRGVLETLTKEHNELAKMLSNVRALIQMHLKRLEELGVKIEKTSGKTEKKA